MKIFRPQILILVFLIFYAFVIFVLKPYVLNRNVTRLVTTVLTYLKNNDLNRAYDYWNNPYKTPPMYGVTSFQIKKKSFDVKGDINTAQFFITLDFSKDNLIPSGQEWIIELSDTPIGWKIFDFRLANQPSSF